MNLAGFMAVVNITVIYLALPYIERALHAGIADQEWIVSIYPLMEGGFTLAAGTLGDLYGRKRILTMSTWLFVLATVGCALSPSAPVLIVMRALQGLGGAALLSLPVAILLQMLPEGADNEDTIKVFSTVAGSGGIAGPIIGGVLVHLWGWPAVFYLSIAMGITRARDALVRDRKCTRFVDAHRRPGAVLQHSFIARSELRAHRRKRERLELAGHHRRVHRLCNRHGHLHCRRAAGAQADGAFAVLPIARVRRGLAHGRRQQLFAFTVFCCSAPIFCRMRSIDPPSLRGSI